MDAALQNFDVLGAKLGTFGASPPMTLLGVSRLALPPLMVEIEATLSPEVDSSDRARGPFRGGTLPIMRRAERLFRVVNEMRTRSVTRAEDLAKHLEVSVRTIYRDLAHLQASGLPIEGEAGVGYLLRPGFDLPSVTFTHEQVDALAIGLSFVESLDDPVLASAAQEVRAKLQASLPHPEQPEAGGCPLLLVSPHHRRAPARQAYSHGHPRAAVRGAALCRR